MTILRAGRTTGLGAAMLLALAGCASLGDAIPKGGPIAQNLAEDYARMSSGMSTAPVSVVSSRLSTYGAEHPGGTAAQPADQVWAVLLAGSFPAASCLVPIPVFSFSLTGTPSPARAYANPCPAPASHERVLIDARSGSTLEVIPGG